MKGSKKQRGRDPKAWTLIFDGPQIGGKRKQQWVAFYGTEREADAELRRLLVDVDAGRFVRAGKLTVGEYLDEWLLRVKDRVMTTDAEVRDIAPSSWKRWDAVVRNNIKPVLGDVRLDKLTGLHIEKALKEWRTMKRADDREGVLSQRTVHYIFTTLENALNRAVRWRLILTNPCNDVDKPKKGRKKLSPLTIDEFKKTMIGLQQSHLFIPSLTAAMTGVRRGELLGFQRRDLDLEQAILWVDRSQTIMLDGEPNAYKDTKTDRRRAVPLNTVLQIALRDHVARLGPGEPTDPLFPDPARGGMWTLQHFHKDFFRARARLGVMASPQRLRHAFSNLAQHQGAAMKVVSEILGHSTTQTTDSTYTFVFDDRKREAVESLGAFVSSLLAEPTKEGKKP